MYLCFSVDIIILYLVPDPTVSIAIPSPLTVGQSLTLYCNGTTVRGITSDVDIVWRRNNTMVNITRVTATNIMDNLWMYKDLYIISQLNTSDNKAVYKCSIVVRTYPQVTATDAATLNVTGK